MLDDLTERVRSLRTELLKAVDLNPGADSNRLQAAVALQRANRLPEAANQFEIVFAKSPTDERVCYALLQIYTRLKDENHLARYRELYNKIVKARNANSAITESTPGGASYPTR